MKSYDSVSNQGTTTADLTAIYQNCTKPRSLRKNDNFSSLLKSQGIDWVKLEKKNPWLGMAGVFKDDPQFEQMLEAIENYRHEIDTTNYA